ncbi:MAG: MurR/RpiR family transcriptional regulator [Firmicutes bacterium]|jgi:DNA-binding MurR/RpiR family transcriptional regulator|nr:MurR/RpiR family transcriptional regulator [Bacillota bacterium]
MSNNYYYLLTNLLSEEEKRVITSIVQHIENNSGKVGIQQIADENFVSTAFIMKLCKRLGFDGYSELFYYLALQNANPVLQGDPQRETLQNLIDNYHDDEIQSFCKLLAQFREQKIFAVGAGFADLVADYIVQRLAVCGFMVFNRVHFYDLMLMKEERQGGMVPVIEPSMIIAISQSGETDTVLNDVRRAKESGFKVLSFSRRAESTLAELSDILFLVNTAKQTLISEVPNSFFGKVILAFEELLGIYLR